MLQRAAVFQLSGDARGAESADPGRDAGRPGTVLDHAVCVLPPHRFTPAGVAYGAEEGAVGIAGQFGRRDIFVEEPLQRVMAGHLMFLSALLVEAGKHSAWAAVGVSSGRLLA